jgi:hypothetical protein
MRKKFIFTSFLDVIAYNKRGKILWKEYFYYSSTQTLASLPPEAQREPSGDMVTVFR